MKRLLIITLSTLLSVCVYAQKEAVVTITNSSIQKNDDKVLVSFRALVPKLGSNYKINIVPELHGTLGNQTLRTLSIVGKKKLVSDLRFKLMFPNVQVGAINTVVDYTFELPYESWMNEVSLTLNNTIEGCCEEDSLSSQTPISNQLLHFEIVPNFDTLVIEHKESAFERLKKEIPSLYRTSDYAKRNDIFQMQRGNDKLLFFCKQGISNIDLAYKNNGATLQTINAAFEKINAEPEVVLKKVVIAGLASPDGNLSSNIILAEKRSKSLLALLKRQQQMDPSLFETLNGSEDWSGLRIMIEKSNMTHRDEVLSIIDNHSVANVRKQKLKQLANGAPYRYMLKNFYPFLRNAGYVQIYCEEILDLSAGLIEEGEKLAKKGEYEKALSALLKVEDKTTISNLLGVCYMMLKDYKQAEVHFKVAVANGSSSAQENLNQITKLLSIQNQ